MDPELIRKVEAVLFASGRFVDASHIASLMEMQEKNVVRALQTLQVNYAESGSALRVVEEDGAWKVHVRDEYLDLVSRVVSDTEVSGPVLETLAVIAWRTPILQAEVVDIRGSNAYEHIKELVERSFVVKEPQGRTYQLRITDKFFDYFDIEGRDDIRKVFKEVEEEHRRKEMERELEQKRLEEALKKAEGGGAVVVDEPVEKPKTSGRTMNIDNLDEVLDKAAKKREEMNQDLQTLRKQEPEQTEESTDDLDEVSETDEKTEEESAESTDENVKEPSEISTDDDDDDTLEETRNASIAMRKKLDEEIEKMS